MKRLLIMICTAICMVGATGAFAQTIPPGGSIYNPPPPRPPPPPKIEVPAIPKMDALPTRPSVSTRGRASFGDRMSRCMDEAASGGGLSQAGRAAYARSCANRD
ncbi:hypothetical protein MTX26_14665 [Bradyrhizobium sp. ISRA443]|uniref:hypothetical protein n=1 Tax=unclassified Bradyrhizobium TaxID=2631580 RepID=UPI00247A719D|nr:MULTISPECIES: hypothetical protein [unclassified Bradyrhizobium]WGR96093.1 hypothetical protein MTX20_25195 [Bradyrhizobium sp. ISRA435]WGS01978.1 hypothetical protein MTX23_14675 [Bradyrhizobium sp. ISRA436]WGS08863.1 hypothetical protein MTX18_14665 [Bradyrhizobium sp. ISRA437]WGS15752.1 hypothetical protein MTX26_14665 [Bradyrhizobium sp. ISRA443]